MSEQHSVVARFLDGSVLKGITDDFQPDRGHFNVYEPGADRPTEVKTDDLKALFFVKSLMGDSDRHDVRSFLRQPGPSQGEKIAIRFRDGEVVCGYTNDYASDAAGFFMLPASANSNNKQAYVPAHATAEVKVGTEAEMMLRRLLDSQAA